MRMTLLELVNAVLTSTDSDAVNSINDTVEAGQVVDIIHDVFLGMQSNRNWATNKKLIQLDNVLDVDRPNYIKVPENVKEMEFFKYDVSTTESPALRYQTIKFVEPDKFLMMISGRNPNLESVKTVTDFGGSKLLIINNRPPSYWTTFDDVYIVTDSYDSAVDDTLKGDKTQVLAYMAAKWVALDEAIPDIPVNAFSALLEEAKSTAHIVLKQTLNQKAETNSLKQQRWLSRHSWKLNGGPKTPNYGRRG
jgi:hypothetical protein